MTRARRLLAASMLLAATPAMAHGLLVSIRGEGSTIYGKVYYSNGEIGAGQYIELTDLDRPGVKPLTGKTDAAGAFRLPGISGDHYRFLTEGEEGHQTEMRIALVDGAKGKFVDRDATARSWFPPAWAVIGIALLLLTAFALVRRKRSASE